MGEIAAVSELKRSSGVLKKGRDFEKVLYKLFGCNAKDPDVVLVQKHKMSFDA